MRPFLLLVLLVASLLTLLAPAEAADDPVELPGEFMGMVTRDPHYEWRTNPSYPGTNEAFYDAMGENLRHAGVKWVRIEFRAEDPGSDMAGRVRLEQYDYFVNIVAPRHGFKVLALLATPLAKWPAGEAPEGKVTGDYIEPKDPDHGIEAGAIDGSCFPYGCGTNQYMRIWLRNAFEIAQRFPYDKTTGAGIAAYEVMNEENRYLNGGGKGMSPEQVAVLVTKFYRIFKLEGGPDRSLGEWRNDVLVILGGIHPGRCDDCTRADGVLGMNDREYLNAIYQSAAFRNFKDNDGRGAYPIDGVGYHPYPLEIRPGLRPEETAAPALGRVPERIRAMRQVMMDNGDARNTIWVTEIGDRGAPQDPDNQRRQADFLRTLYWLLWQQRAYVKHVFWFKYEDFAVPQATRENPDPTGPENWGVVRLLPRNPPGSCSDCVYDPDGTVQVYKQSFMVYADMSRYGTGLQSHRVYVPMISQGP